LSSGLDWRQDTAKIRIKKTHKIKDLCLKAVPILPSYEPAPIAYRARNMREGSVASKKGNLRLFAIIQMINTKAASHRRFSTPANKLAGLVVSLIRNGRKRKVEVMYGALHAKQK